MAAMRSRAESVEAHDQMLGEGSTRGNAVVQSAIDALVTRTRSIERAVAALGLGSIEAVRLIEFLAGDIARQMYASSSFEYPVKAGVATDPFIESLGEFRADTLSLSEIARHRKAASRLVDRVGFEAGPGG